MFKHTLVPEEYFSAAAASKILASVAVLEKGTRTRYKELPRFKAVLVYSGEESRASLLETVITAAVDGALDKPDRHCAVLRFSDGEADVAAALGERLLLACTYPAQDRTTAEYFLYAALSQLKADPKKTQIITL